MATTVKNTSGGSRPLADAAFFLALLIGGNEFSWQSRLA
jgi:hypothetical protein